MARKRPVPEVIEPTTAPKRGRASKAQTTGTAATAPSTAHRRTVAQKKPRQAVRAPTTEVSETKAREQTASTRPKQSAASKKQKSTASTTQKQTTASKDQKKAASSGQKHTAASKGQRKTTSTRQKCAADSKEEQEAPPTKKQKGNVPTAAKPDPSTAQTPFATPPPETKKEPSRPCAYNFEFFEDMANTIASNFPFANFAARHGCNIHEVARVISAIVIAPLSDPSFDWYDDEDLTIPSYVMLMMEMWERHYQKTLVANVPPLEPDNNTDRTENLDESGDASSSESDSETSSTDSPDDSSSSFSKSAPGPSGFVGDFDRGSRAGMSSVEQLKNSGNYTSSQCAENRDEETKQVHGSDDASDAGDEVSEGVRMTAFKAVREPELRRPKWVPVDQPRVHVYKDEWGRYVPVPTKEEQEEQAHRQWLEKEARCIRQNRGRGMLEPSSMQNEIGELGFVDLDVGLSEENFGDVDLVDPRLCGAVEDSYPALGGGEA